MTLVSAAKYVKQRGMAFGVCSTQVADNEHASVWSWIARWAEDSLQACLSELVRENLENFKGGYKAPNSCKLHVWRLSSNRPARRRRQLDLVLSLPMNGEVNAIQSQLSPVALSVDHLPGPYVLLRMASRASCASTTLDDPSTPDTAHVHHVQP